MAKLITEQNFNVKTLIVENESEGKSLFIEGIFMQAETPNRNKRYYPLGILEKEVNRYVQEFVNESRALGELNHPDSPMVDPSKASHLITSLQKEGNNFVGRAKILNTPCGNIVRGLIEGGVKMGVSSRGMGSLKERQDGINEVQEDFLLSTVDIVHDPSAPQAFVNGIMEGKEWVWENGILTARDVETYRKEVESTSKENIAEAQIRAFEDFLKRLK